ncbi:MAG TPA: phosphatidate cytidylyltransferase [Acidobacteriota bacterium]|nr:phosphatidate cytidylyltransferase [Acidobacteriota bacterium]
MLLRIASAVVLVPAVIAVVVYASPVWFFLALGIVGSLCLYEYLGLVRLMGLHSQSWYGYAAFWILLAGFRQTWIPLTAVLSVVLLVGFLAAIWRRDALRDSVFGLMANLLGAFYLAVFLYPALPLRFDFGDRQGLHWFVVLLAVIWIGDTAALLVGRVMGRTPFAPLLSPKKTNEGAVGGLLAGVAAAVVLQHFLYTELPILHVVVLSLIAGGFGQLGDLAESLLKRAAQVKDSSHLIPGHGGVLDRVDSLLFAFPVSYIYLLRLYSS